MFIFIRILGNNELFSILWILSDTFELDANIVNFVYFGKTRLEALVLQLPDNSILNVSEPKFIFLLSFGSINT